MEKSKEILVNIFQETSKIFWILLRVILPVVIIIRILELIGAIPFLAQFLEPLTNFIGIDGSLGLVWMAAILVNIYAGLAAFASLQAIFDYTIAETTILGLIILIAHSLPIEVAIAKKSRISWVFNLTFRFVNAVIAGKILNLCAPKSTPTRIPVARSVLSVSISNRSLPDRRLAMILPAPNLTSLTTACSPGIIVASLCRTQTMTSPLSGVDETTVPKEVSTRPSIALPEINCAPVSDKATNGWAGSRHKPSGVPS